MNHYNKEQIATFFYQNIDMPRYEEFLSHIDECALCRNLYVQTLFPHSELEAPLCQQEKDSLFESIFSGMHKKYPPRARNFYLWKIITFRSRFSFALAAILTIVLIPIMLFFGKLNDRKNFSSASRNADEKFYIKEIDDGVLIDNVRVNKTNTVLDTPFEIITTDSQKATILLGADLSLTFFGASRGLISKTETDTIVVELMGELHATLKHSRHRNLFIRVVGGTYHVVGTIFRINADSVKTTITVEEGKVVFIANRDGVFPDTIVAGLTKTFTFIPDTAKPKNTTTHFIGKKAVASTIFSSKVISETDSTNKPQDSTTDLQQQKFFLACRMMILGKRAHQIADTLIAAYGSNLPDSALLLLAIAYEREANLDSAYIFYSAAAVAEPVTSHNAGAALIAKARIDVQLRANYNDALKAYEKYLKLYPTGQHRDIAYEGIYTYYFKNNDYTRQLQILQEWMDASPQNDYPVYLLASTYRQMNRLQKAVQYYQTYRIKYPQGRWLEDAYLWEWKCYQMMGLNDEYARTRRDYESKFPKGKWIENANN